MGIVRMRELYIVNEIEEGVGILLRLFLSGGIASVEKLNVEIILCLVRVSLTAV
jgi:hypothetical protein